MADNLTNDEIQDLINKAQQNSGGDDGSSPFIGNLADFDEFDESNVKTFVKDDKLEFIKDLQLHVYIELGRTQMKVKDILELDRGYVIELDKLASEPVDVYVNNKKIAEGEVVVIDKHFGIRITSLVETADKIKSNL